MTARSLWGIILPIYDQKAFQRSYCAFLLQYQHSKTGPRHDTAVSITMAKVSWSCVEVACCVPNCSTPCFNPQISHMIPKSPLTPQTPISACNARPSVNIGDRMSSPCCDKTHKHFLYSIVLPKSKTNSNTFSNTIPEISTPGKPETTASSTYSSPSSSVYSSPSSIDSAPIFTPTSPPERPSLRARRDTLSKLKIPESPPLSQENLLPRSQPSSAQPPSSRANNRSAGASMYPDMFLPMPAQSQMGAGNISVSPLSGAYPMTVSPLTSAYTPLFSRDILAMSPISPLMYSNNPSPIMGAA